MKTVHLTEIGNDLRNLLDEAADAKEGLKVIREDGTAIVLLTMAEYSGLKETAFLLSSPANALHLAQSMAEWRAGQVVKHELIEVGDVNAQPPVHK